MNNFRKIKLENVKKSLCYLQERLEKLHAEEIESYYKLSNDVADSCKGEQIRANAGSLWFAASSIEDILDELENIN